LAPFVGNVADGALIQVADDGDVVLAPAGRFLVQPEVGGGTRLFDRKASGQGPLHQMPGLVPAGTQQAAGAPDVALFQHIDGQTFEEDGGPGHRLGPGQADLEHAVFGAVDPWRPGVQVGEELAAVEVGPLPFLCVVVGREIGNAHGTGKPRASDGQPARRSGLPQPKARPGSPPTVTRDARGGGRARCRA